jgi:GTP-binding protein
VLDVSGIEGRDPIEDFEKINRELASFSETLAECPQIVVANKSDMAQPEQIERLQSYITEKGLPFYTISAATTQGTGVLMAAVGQALSELPPIKVYEEQPLSQAELEARFSSRQDFEVEVEDGIYYISAPWLEPILRTVNMDDYSSLQYFQRVLRSSGIIDRLEEMGIEEGQTVNIFGFEFDFIR